MPKIASNSVNTALCLINGVTLVTTEETR